MVLFFYLYFFYIRGLLAVRKHEAPLQLQEFFEWHQPLSVEVLIAQVHALAALPQRVRIRFFMVFHSSRMWCVCIYCVYVRMCEFACLCCVCARAYRHVLSLSIACVSIAVVLPAFSI